MDIFSLLDELQTIARNGLAYAENPYDRERYERLMALACRTYSQILDVPESQVRQRFIAELGYITPKVGAEAAIFDASGNILLMRRADDGLWCLPCGWVEPGESPEETAVREAKEETGLEVRVLELVGVFTRKPSPKHGPHTAIAVVYLCEVMGGMLRLSHEGIELRYWRIEDVTAWHELHHQYATAAHAAWQKRAEELDRRFDV